MSDAQGRQIPADMRFTVRVFTTLDLDPQVFTDVKHVFWHGGRNGDAALMVMHYYPDGSHRYVGIPREHVSRYTMTREDGPGTLARDA